MVYGTLCRGVDYYLTLCPLQHMYHGRSYAKVDLNPVPESTLSSSQGLIIWPLKQNRNVCHLENADSFASVMSEFARAYQCKILSRVENI
jgi:hypothetical protein